MFTNRPVVLLVDAHQIPIVLRLIFDPLLDLAFREFPDPLRLDEALVCFHPGIVVGILQIIVIAAQYPVCVFRVSLFGYAEKNHVSYETDSHAVQIVGEVRLVVIDTQL